MTKNLIHHLMMTSLASSRNFLSRISFGPLAGLIFGYFFPPGLVLTDGSEVVLRPGDHESHPSQNQKPRGEASPIAFAIMPLSSLLSDRRQILVRIAAEVVLHRKLRFDVTTLDRGSVWVSFRRTHQSLPSRRCLPE